MPRPRGRPARRVGEEEEVNSSGSLEFGNHLEDPIPPNPEQLHCDPYEFFRQFMAAATPPCRDIMKDIMAFNLPTLDGQLDTSALENWIEELETIFELTQCPDDLKVVSAAYFLKGHANRWWCAENLTAEGLEEMDWESFKVKLRQRFYPNHIRKAKRAEFNELVQGSMTMEEYLIKFNELLMFVPNVACDEEEKVERFIQGLNQKTREAMAMQKVTSLQEAYELAASFYATATMLGGSLDRSRSEIKGKGK